MINMSERRCMYMSSWSFLVELVSSQWIMNNAQKPGCRGGPLHLGRHMIDSYIILYLIVIICYNIILYFYIPIICCFYMFLLSPINGLSSATKVSIRQPPTCSLHVPQHIVRGHGPHQTNRVYALVIYFVDFPIKDGEIWWVSLILRSLRSYVAVYGCLPEGNPMFSPINHNPHETAAMALPLRKPFQPPINHLPSDAREVPEKVWGSIGGSMGETIVLWFFWCFLKVFWTIVCFV